MPYTFVSIAIRYALTFCFFAVIFAFYSSRRFFFCTLYRIPHLITRTFCCPVTCALFVIWELFCDAISLR